MELLIVIVVLGVLAGVALPVYSTMVLKAEATEAVGVLGAMRTAELRYFSEFGLFGECDASGCQLDFNARTFDVESGQSTKFTYEVIAANIPQADFVIEARHKTRALSLIIYSHNFPTATAPLINNNFGCTGDFANACPSM